MQVKLEISSFEGFADLSGAELEVLTRALGKVFRTEQRYVESAYVQVKKPGKIEAKFTISPGVTFMTQDEYDFATAAQDAREAKLAADQLEARAKAAALVLAVPSTPDDRKVAFEALIALLDAQGMLYYKEKQNARMEVLIDDDQVTFQLPDYDSVDDTTKGYTASVTRSGKFVRTSNKA